MQYGTLLLIKCEKSSLLNRCRFVIDVIILIYTPGESNHSDIHHWSCHIKAEAKSFRRYAVKAVRKFAIYLVIFLSFAGNEKNERSSREKECYSSFSALAEGPCHWSQR